MDYFSGIAERIVDAPLTVRPRNLAFTELDTLLPKQSEETVSPPETPSQVDKVATSPDHQTPPEVRQPQPIVSQSHQDVKSSEETKATAGVQMEPIAKEPAVEVSLAAKPEPPVASTVTKTTERVAEQPQIIPHPVESQNEPLVVAPVEHTKAEPSIVAIEPPSRIERIKPTERIVVVDGPIVRHTETIQRVIRTPNVPRVIQIPSESKSAPAALVEDEASEKVTQPIVASVPAEVFIRPHPVEVQAENPIHSVVPLSPEPTQPTVEKPAALPPQTIVEVHIGHIEVTSPSRPAPAPARSEIKGYLNLDEVMNRSRGGSR